MKRLQYSRYGGPEVLSLDDVDVPSPGRGEVLVRVLAAAANAMDWKARRGEMPSLPWRGFPRGVGYDFAGVVDRCGAGVTTLRVGDEVLGTPPLQQPGAFADFVVAKERSVARKPDTLSFAEAATLPVVGLTAYQAVIEAGRLQPRQAIFVNGCLGGVGSIAVQVAAGLGASVTGSCRPGWESEARQLGVETVVGYDEDPAPTARFDVVLDTAGTLPYASARRMLKPRGRIVDIVPSLAKVARSILPGPYRAFMGRSNSRDLQYLADAAGRGEISVRIARTVPLADAIPALAEWEHAPTSSAGKLVITST